MGGMGENQDTLWDEEDGFFYNLVRFPDGRAARLKVRSMAGLLPLCATTVFDAEVGEKFPRLLEQVQYLLARPPEARETFALAGDQGIHERRCLAILNEKKLRKVLQKMLDENEFLSPYGIRSLSRWHLEHPLVINVHGEESPVSYLPAESNTGMFGGNSNWRGPIWFPINILILRALLQFYRYYGDRLAVECPTGSGNPMNLFQVAMEIGRRLSRIFLRDEKGRRPVYGGTEKFQTDPHWRDHILFYEYFNGDNGAGLGASHQTGGTGLVARVIQMLGSLDPRVF